MSRTTAEKRLAQVELTLKKRIAGRRLGETLTLLRGEGLHPADVREYSPGDDVRQLDWNLTARTGAPHIKTFEAEHEMTVWVLLDLTPSMNWGTALWTKQDLALNLTAAVALITVRSRNRIGGAGMFGGAFEVIHPAVGANAGPRLLHFFERCLSRSSSSLTPPGSLRYSLLKAERVLRKRGLVVIVSDFMDSGFRQPLGRLARRHDVIAIKPTDPREHALPDIGTVWFEDPESGRQIEVDTSRPGLRKAYETYAGAQKARIAAAIRGTGASLFEISTSADWLGELIKFLEMRNARP